MLYTLYVCHEYFTSHRNFWAQWQGILYYSLDQLLPSSL